MLKKKLGTMLLAGLMVLGTCMTTVSAKNNSDTSYDIILTVTTTQAYTSTQAKEDTSSTYVKLTSVPCEYVYCNVQGYCPNTATSTYVWSNQNKGDDDVVLRTGTWLIRQYVYEHYGRLARLKFRPGPNIYFGNLRGVWSPDSVTPSESYKYAN